MPAKKVYGEPDVKALKERVALRVRESSVRQVAGEVGMSVSGLHDFLYAEPKRPPHERTRHKLVNWYRTQFVGGTPSRGSEISAATAGAALGLIVDHLSVSDQRKAVEGIAALMDELSVEKKPRWLKALKRELSSGAR